MSWPPGARRTSPRIGGWERRHSPGTFTYASHAAFFAGFLPTPARPGRHRRLLALHFDTSETIGDGTWVLGATIVEGLAMRGYHTLCVGGTGFFNLKNPLGNALPGLFAERYWTCRRASPAWGLWNPINAATTTILEALTARRYQASAQSDHGHDGSLGTRVLEKFQLTFDYAGERICFRKRDGA